VGSLRVITTDRLTATFGPSPFVPWGQPVCTADSPQSTSCVRADSASYATYWLADLTDADLTGVIGYNP
jgi:hypothetical protein